MSEEVVDFRAKYEAARPDLDAAATHLADVIKRCASELSDPALVRVRLTEVRVKEAESLLRKAREHGWPLTEALWRPSDLVGARVVCNNTEDVRRLVEIIRDEYPWGDIVAIEDRIGDPAPDGYRAIHLNVVLELPGRTLVPKQVPCEIQVRSLLQDAWAQLVHRDVYKEGEQLPEDLREQATDLAGLLSAADDIAGRIRERVAQARPEQDGAPDLGEVTAEGLTFVYRAKFGRSPSDYIVRATLENSLAAGIDSLEALPGLLDDEHLRGRVEKAVQSFFPMPLRADEFFQVLPFALADGPDKAVSMARAKAEAEWDEIDARYRHEAGAEMPEDLDALIEELAEGSLNVGTIATFLDAGHARCAVCSAELIDPEAFEAAVMSHYGADNRWGEIEGHLFGDGFYDVVSINNSHLCPYHDEVMSRDD